MHSVFSEDWEKDLRRYAVIFRSAPIHVASQHVLFLQSTFFSSGFFFLIEETYIGLRLSVTTDFIIARVSTYFLTYSLPYLITHSLTYLLTPWSWVLLEKLTGSQLGKKFPTYYGTRRFITTFTSACHLSLSWARSIQSPSHFLKLYLNIILLFTPRSSK